MSTAEKFEVLQAELDQALAEILKLKRQLQHQGEPVTDDEILKMADKAFGQIVDYDLRGNPITDFRVLTIGAYGPAIRRLVRLARTHADPAEVERLRKENTDLCESLKELNGIERKRDAALAQLAKAHALLSKAYKDMEDTIGQSWCISCHQWPEDDGVITHAPSCTFCAMEVALSASADPSAPVVVDERAEFEAWFKDHSKDWPFPSESIKCIARDNDWLVWQARAALERKQQKTPQ